ncbi:hypothetical protein Pint_24572 [Pistacia integerrima]|uniref:Uncharacterized protein n=1 Tax=Pistacia integerrima TaxID=434235 RepID=A0ACC0YBS7_9ROSI|nr:hypothetical protein Pint_24572 [Pistacia integerrima]
MGINPIRSWFVIATAIMLLLPKSEWDKKIDVYKRGWEPSVIVKQSFLLSLIGWRKRFVNCYDEAPELMKLYRKASSFKECKVKGKQHL